MLLLSAVRRGLLALSGSISQPARVDVQRGGSPSANSNGRGPAENAFPCGP